jgi:hypothetical protein
MRGAHQRRDLARFELACLCRRCVFRAPRCLQLLKRTLVQCGQQQVEWPRAALRVRRRRAPLLASHRRCEVRPGQRLPRLWPPAQRAAVRFHVKALEAGGGGPRSVVVAFRQRERLDAGNLAGRGGAGAGRGDVQAVAFAAISQAQRAGGTPAERFHAVEQLHHGEIFCSLAET